MDSGKGGYFLRKLFGGEAGGIMPFSADFGDLERLSASGVPQTSGGLQSDSGLSNYEAVVVCGFKKISAGNGYVNVVGNKKFHAEIGAVLRHLFNIVIFTK